MDGQTFRMTDKIKPEWGAGLCLRVLNMYDVLCPAHLYLLLMNLHSSYENDSVWNFFFFFGKVYAREGL